MVFVSLGIIPRNGMLGYKRDKGLIFIRNARRAFQSNFIILRFHCFRMKILVALHSHHILSIFGVVRLLKLYPFIVGK